MPDVRAPIGPRLACLTRLSCLLRLALVGVLAAPAVAGCAQQEVAGTAPSPAYPLIDCPDLPTAEPRTDGLPDLELPCLGNGPPVRLSDLRGTPTLVTVWAAWCTNCPDEMPLFADALARAGERLQVFGVHYKASEERAVAAAEDFGVVFPSVHDGPGNRTVAALRATAPPQTFFVTADGRVAFRQVGVIRSQRELDRLIRRHLGVAL